MNLGGGGGGEDRFSAIPIYAHFRSGKEKMSKHFHYITTIGFRHKKFVQMDFKVCSGGFQSLFGWISKFVRVDFKVCSGGFQSLFGWISKFVRVDLKVCSGGFQSLFGWISKFVRVDLFSR